MKEIIDTIVMYLVFLEAGIMYFKHRAYLRREEEEKKNGINQL